MKKIFYFFAATLLLSLAGCVDTPSVETAVLSFVFRAADNPALSEDVNADISGTSITTLCPAGTDLTALVPAVTVSEGASLSPAGGTMQDFSGPVVYRVTAADGESYTDYTVPVAAGAFTLRSSVGRLKSWFWYADAGTDDLTFSIYKEDGLDCSWTATVDGSWASLD